MRESIETVQKALDLKDLRVFPTSGGEFDREHKQWDDGNHVVALEPGLVVEYNGNE